MSDGGKSSAVYDRFAADYDRRMRPLERVGLGRLRARILSEIPEGSRVLEVGAGTGMNFPFYPRACTAACVEPSREMIVRANAKSDRPEGALLVQARAEELPFGAGSFDAAFATLVFCSVASPARAFAELRRVVRAGGRVALLEHVRPRNPLGYFFDALTRITVPLFDDHFNRRTAEEARGAGLTVERVENRLLGVVQLIVCRVSL
ncbi:MAG TPA: methyltransferase domain-containing protein [Pyrinomonadaceae bacterium]|jgi:ubiquinone/menaquinone biosynthesis C-methylase UbiE|nr:methyltransferase domain-containing protein [Pyrinomonadaceae bacterium]